MEADPATLAPLTFVSATGKRSYFHLLMPIFVCRQWAGEPRGAEGQRLAWVSTQQLAGADTEPGGCYAMAPGVRPNVLAVLDVIERQLGRHGAAAAPAAGVAGTA